MKRLLSSATVVLAGAALLTACTGSSSDTGAAAGPSSTGSPGSVASSAPPSPTTPASTAPSPSASGSRAASPAAVALSRVDGSSTRLTVDARFLQAVKAVGLQISPVGGAKTDSSGGRTTIVFPITGGTASTSTGGDRFSGSVQHAGGLKLSGLGRSVTLDHLVLDGSSDELTGQVNGRRVPLLPLQTDAGHVSGSADQIVLEADSVSLRPDALRALSGPLHLPSLPSVPLGSLSSTITGS